MVEMVAGYEPDKVKDKEGLGRWVGSNLILMGILVFFHALTGLFLPQMTSGYLVAGFFIIVIVLSLRTSFGCKKYSIKY